jgi:SAM-dependent methyltransferase
VSRAAAAYARDALGVPVRTGTLEDARFDDGAFSAATLTHVLEHVADPVALLRGLHRVLEPGAILNVAVPHARALIHDAYNLYHRARGRYGKDKFACGLFPPDHLFAFDRTSLRRALERGGFRVLRFEISGKGDPDHYPMVSWRGAGRAPALERPLEWLGRKTGRGSLLDCIAHRA